jgi:hypothetical protein
LRRSFPLLVVICVPFLLSCGADEPACETREAGLRQQRWILECSASARDTSPVASYFDPGWTEQLPSSVHIYCSDRGLTFAWNPGVRTADRSGRWRDKLVAYRFDGGRQIQNRWMVSTDDHARPTYYLFGGTAATFVEALREARELTLETTVDQDQEPTVRLITLEGLRDVLVRIPCLPEG